MQIKMYIRKIDELGRLTLPAEFLHVLDLSVGESTMHWSLSEEEQWAVLRKSSVPPTTQISEVGTIRIPREFHFLFYPFPSKVNILCHSKKKELYLIPETASTR